MAKPMSVLCLTFLATGFCAAAAQERDHLYWRRLAITSQASQIADEKFYIVTGNSLAAEAIMPARVCWFHGLNAAIDRASDQEISDVISALQPRPALIIIVGSLKGEFGDIPIAHVEGNLEQLSLEIPKKAASLLGC